MKKRSEALDSVVSRVGLLAQIESYFGVVVVEAPRGYGKSTLLRQYAATERDDGTSVVLVGDDERYVDVHAFVKQLNAAPPDSVRVVIDDASRWPDLVAAAVEHRQGLRQLVVADRSFTESIETVLDEFNQRRMVDTQLRFSPREMIELLSARDVELAEDIAWVIGPACDGWPEGVLFYLDLLAQADDVEVRAAELAYPGPHTDELLRRQFAGLDDELVDAIGVVAHLEGFTSGCIEALTAGTANIHTVRAAGLTVVRSEPDFYRLPNPIATALRERTTLTDDDARMLAPIVMASTNTIHGLTTAVRVGCFDEAAVVLEGLHKYRLDEFAQADLISVVRPIRRHLDNPRLAMIEFRALRNLGRISEAMPCLEACLSMSAEADPSDERMMTLRIEARIESLYTRAFSGDLDPSREIEEIRKAANGAMIPAHRLLLEEIESFLLGQADDPSTVSAACDALHDVATSWMQQGEKTRAVSTWRRLAATALVHLGRYDEGVTILRRAQKLMWNRLIDRTLVLQLSCRMQALGGDFERIDSDLKEAWACANAAELPWVKAFLHWSEMWLAARRGDAPVARAALKLTEQALGPLLGHETGVVFHSEAAIAMAEVGDIEAAADQLDEAAKIDAESEVEFRFAQIVVHARRGRVREVDLLAEVFRSSGTLPPIRAWRLDLEQAIARHIAGGYPDTIDLRDAALQFAEESGQRRLAEMIAVPVWTREHDPVVDPIDSTTRIELLGKFEVWVNGAVVAMPEGHVALLLKMIAVSDTPVAVDIVLEALWPGEEPRTSRRRIKNVLGRLRSHIGADSVVRANDALWLAPDVVVDLHTFEQKVRRALSPDHDDAATQVDEMVAALDAYGGSLLPADLYDDWFGSRRDAAQARALAVVDRLASFEPELRPSATWLLDVVLRIDAADDQRLVEIARQALLEGHELVANAALEQAMAAAEDLGISIDDEVDALRLLL